MKHYLLSAATFAFLAFSCTYEGLATNNDASENNAPSVASHTVSIESGDTTQAGEDHRPLINALAAMPTTEREVVLGATGSQLVVNTLAGLSEEERAEVANTVQQMIKGTLSQDNV